MTTKDNKPKSNPKMDKFLEEINALGAKYQYRIVPVLRYTPEGIFPGMQILDILPPEGKKKATNGKPTIPDIKPKKGVIE